MTDEHTQQATGEVERAAAATAQRSIEEDRHIAEKMQLSAERVRQQIEELRTLMDKHYLTTPEIQQTTAAIVQIQTTLLQTMRDADHLLRDLRSAITASQMLHGDTHEQPEDV